MQKYLQPSGPSRIFEESQRNIQKLGRLSGASKTSEKYLGPFGVSWSWNH